MQEETNSLIYITEIKEDIKELKDNLKTSLLLWREEVKADYKNLQTALSEIQSKLTSFITRVEVDSLMATKVNVNENNIKLQEIESRITKLETSPARMRDWVAFGVASLGCLFSSLLGLTGLILSLVNYFSQHLH